MTGAQRPHHRNIYCIIYSASPLVQGERTHINFQPRSSPPHSRSCLLRCSLARSLSFIPFFILCCFFFRDAAQGASTGALRPFQSSLAAEDAPFLPSSLFFHLISCFSAFLVLLFLLTQLEKLKDSRQQLAGFMDGCSAWNMFQTFKECPCHLEWMEAGQHCVRRRKLREEKLCFVEHVGGAGGGGWCRGWVAEGGCCSMRAE